MGAQDTARPGPWTLQLAEPVSITARATTGTRSPTAGYTVLATAGQARLTGPLPAGASRRRARGDLRILAGDATAITAVQSSGQGTGAGATAVIATEASASPSAS